MILNWRTSSAMCCVECPKCNMVVERRPIPFKNLNGEGFELFVPGTVFAHYLECPRHMEKPPAYRGEIEPETEVGDDEQPKA